MKGSVNWDANAWFRYGYRSRKAFIMLPATGLANCQFPRTLQLFSVSEDQGEYLVDAMQ
jgi:hypothetical protein